MIKQYKGHKRGAIGTQSKGRWIWCDGVDGDLLEKMALALASEEGWSPACRDKKEGPSR